MQFKCLVVNPQSDIAVPFYMVNSHQRATLCLKVARQLNTRSFWSVGFWWLCLFTEVGPAMHVSGALKTCSCSTSYGMVMPIVYITHPLSKRNIVNFLPA